MDPQLINRAQRGDEGAFTTLTVSIGGKLYRTACGILRDRNLAEDAVQAALLQIWRKLPGLRDPERFDAWSYKLLVHACYAEAKRSRTRPLTDLGHPILVDGLAAILDRDELERAFDRLSLDQRTILVLRLYLDLPPDRVGEALGIPVGTVHSRLHRAVDALRASLEADERRAQPAPRTAEVMP